MSPVPKHDEEEVRAALASFFGRHPDISLGKFERMSADYAETTVSKATLSTFRKGGSITRNGSIRQNEYSQDTLAAILDTIKGYEAILSEPVETASLKKILAVAGNSIGNGSINVIIGESGTGKTTAFKEHTRRHPDVIAITAHSAMKQRALLQELCKATKAHWFIRRSPHEILIELSEIAPKQIVIDEADKLSPNCFECLRFLHDRCSTTIILLGLPCIRVKLMTTSDKIENLTQFFSRIDFLKELKEPAREEMIKIIKKLGITRTDMVAAIIEQSSIYGHINMHRIEKLAKGVKEMAVTNKKSLDEASPDWVVKLRKDMI